MQRVKTSWKSFATATRVKRKEFKQNISVKPSMIIRDNLLKCLECYGVQKILIRNGGKVTGFYSKSKPYPHLLTCSQKGRF